MKDNGLNRWALGLIAMTGLVLVFLFQKINIAFWLGAEGKALTFIINRSIRFLLNDLLAIALIYSIFWERKYVVFAFLVQIFGMIFILVPYFIIRFNFTSYHGPLISFLHRLVMNPTLLLILIPAFFYQRRMSGHDKPAP